MPNYFGYGSPTGDVFGRDTSAKIGLSLIHI